ncbi:MAG: FecR domain-containing protein [Trichlorobacter sp.]|uniref:FecR domain-containing protein n=1 Tax=Trichlorobacter sp. TaxID=2911007 RepID=UPI00256DED8E|nr:FecR domain-containing protein [Trichlorobacter sp.]MDK9716445.1 FecR domain-containing protein [Trichlorobacter sp.]
MNRIICWFVLLLSVMSLPLSAAGQNAERTVEIRVAPRDTLIGLCQKYLVQPEKWQQVAKLNRLPDSNYIAPGQKIVVPVALLKGVPMDGTVSFLQGEAFLQPTGSSEWRPLKLREIIREGGALKTAANSALEISFEDGTSFLLREQSLLTVKASKKGPLHLLRVLRLEGGKIISRVKSATGKDSRFEIETPSALAAARGTHYRVAVDGQGTTRAEMLESRTDLSAMGATVPLKEGEGAFARSNEPPSPPIRLLDPPEPQNIAAVYGNKSSTVSFSQVQNAAQYRVLLARDHEGKNAVKTVVIKPDEAFVFEGLEDGSYYLLATSIGEEGLEGAPSKPCEIKVRRKPLPPDIVAPLDKASLPEMPLKSQWHNVLGVSVYQVQIATTPDFSGPLIESGDLKKTIYHSRELQGGTHYLRVRSLAEDGYAGDWSAVRAVSIVKLLPPSLRKPDGDDNKLYLEWEPMKGATGYHLQIARDEAFGSILIDQTPAESKLVLENPPEPGKYYMRVAARNADQETSAFSKSGSFEIEQSKSYFFEALGFVGGVGLALLLVLL